MPFHNKKTETPESSDIPSVITTRKSLFPTSRRLGLFIIALIIVSISILSYKIFTTKLHPPPQTNLIDKQAKLLQVNQGLDEQTTKNKAQEEIKRREKIRLEAQKRGITVTEEEINKEAQRITELTSQAEVTRTLQSYGWSEEDWKEKIRIDILADKLSKSISQWRDYQILMIRWDNPTKTKLPSDDQAWEKAKEILKKTHQRLEKGKEISSVFADLNKDPEINKYFVVQAITKTQRIYSYTEIPSKQLKEYILSTPPNSLSQALRVGLSVVIIKTFDGQDNNGGSLEELLNKKQTFELPQLIKNAYATHESIDSCATIGWQYCAAGDYCYQEGVITGTVFDSALNPLSGATVTAENPTGSNPGCLCTSNSGSATSDFFGGYNVHGLCCFVNPFTVTATKSDYDCASYSVNAQNGINVDQDIICTFIAPPTPVPGATPTPGPVGCFIGKPCSSCGGNSAICFPDCNGGWCSGGFCASCAPPTPTPTPSPTPIPIPTPFPGACVVTGSPNPDVWTGTSWPNVKIDTSVSSMTGGTIYYYNPGTCTLASCLFTGWSVIAPFQPSYNWNPNSFVFSAGTHTIGVTDDTNALKCVYDQTFQIPASPTPAPPTPTPSPVPVPTICPWFKVINGDIHTNTNIDLPC